MWIGEPQGIFFIILLSLFFSSVLSACGRYTKNRLLLQLNSLFCFISSILPSCCHISVWLLWMGEWAVTGWEILYSSDWFLSFISIHNTEALNLTLLRSLLSYFCLQEIPSMVYQLKVSEVLIKYRSGRFGSLSLVCVIFFTVMAYWSLTFLSFLICLNLSLFRSIGIWQSQFQWLYSCMLVACEA